MFFKCYEKRLLIFVTTLYVQSMATLSSMHVFDSLLASVSMYYNSWCAYHQITAVYIVGDVQ